MSQSDEPTQSVIDALYRIASAVNKTEDPHEALNLILNEVVDCMNATSASIALINPDSNKLEIEAFSGLPLNINEFMLSIGQGITGWVALHGKPLLVHDVNEEQRYIKVKDSIRSEMAVPMQIETINVESDQLLTIGVVNVDSETVGAFDEQDLKLLTLITNEATRVVNRIWLINHLKDKANQLESIINIGQQLVKKLELQEVIDSITQQAQSLMNCRLCAFYLVNEDRQSLRLYSLAGPSGKLEYEEKLLLEESSVGVVVQRNKQVAIFDLPLTEEHHFTQLAQSENLSSLLSTPITFENVVVGVLNAYTDKPHRFNNDERKIFATLASMGAVAIQNSRLYSRVFASEESLRKNERLTTLGLLAAEIAHEIRNPLTVIKLLFDSLELNFDTTDARNQDVEVIREKIKHLEEIVGNVLNFGKSNVELHSRWALHNLIEDTLRLVRLKLNQSKIEIHYHPPEKPMWVEVHKGQIQQVILNLIINSMQAMPEGGSITIHVSSDNHETAPHALVTVQDTGTGIPQKISDQIFDSFLTSKRDGTGLGLSISKQIMKQHRGNISLLESSSEGTTFELKLPAV